MLLQKRDSVCKCKLILALQIGDYQNAVIVARHANSVRRATSYAERLHLNIAVIHGEEKLAESETDDGRHSPPPLSIESRTSGGSYIPGLSILPSKWPKVLLL
jgi:hypothetical protein